MDLSERQPEQRESFSDVYLEVLTPVCCGELTELTTTWTKTRMRADRIREHLFSFLTLKKMQAHSQMERANLLLE